jgi:hypothetical protein
MKVIVRGRQSGKTDAVLRLAQASFAYIVCANQQRVEEVWRRILELNLNLPQPITWDAFVAGRYRGRGIKGGFVFDDLDTCLRSMTHVDIKGISLTGELI